MTGRIRFAYVALSALLAGALSAQRPAVSMVEVDGHRLSVHLAGGAKPGQATVVFSSGFGTPAIAWADIQSDIAGLTRTIAYDRSGVGASEASTKPRTIQNLAAEMHELLAKTASPPYVLVGHSYGGPIIHTFAARYPNEVAGIVYVDPTDFMQTEADMRAAAEAGRIVGGYTVLTKLNEQMLNTAGVPDGLRAEAKEIQRAEAEGFAPFRADGDAPNVPTVIVLAGRPQPMPAGVTFPGDMDRWFQATLEQRTAHFGQLAKRTRDGVLILAGASDHYIHSTDPELVTWAVRRVLSESSARPDLQALVGEYSLAPSVGMTVTRDGDKLLVQLSGQPKYVLTPASATAFELRFAGARLEFDVDAAGKSTGVTLVQNGLRQHAERRQP